MIFQYGIALTMKIVSMIALDSVISAFLNCLVTWFDCTNYKHQEQHATLVQAKFVNHTFTLKTCTLMLIWHNNTQLLKVVHVHTVCEACR